MESREAFIIDKCEDILTNLSGAILGSNVVNNVYDKNKDCVNLNYEEIRNHLLIVKGLVKEYRDKMVRSSGRYDILRS